MEEIKVCIAEANRNCKILFFQEHSNCFSLDKPKNIHLQLIHTYKDKISIFIFGPANMVMNAAYSPHWLQTPHMIRVSLYSHEGVFDGLSLPSPF